MMADLDFGGGAAGPPVAPLPTMTTAPLALHGGTVDSEQQFAQHGMQQFGVAQSSRFGATATYHVVALDTLAQAALSNDLGWLGISDELKATMPAEKPASPIVCVIVIPSKRAVIGYGAVLGACESASELKDNVRRDLPRSWQNVVRFAWVRVGEAPYVEFTPEVIGQLEEIANQRTAGKPAPLAAVSEDLGNTLCTAIDEAAKRRVPREIRHMLGGDTRRGNMHQHQQQRFERAPAHQHQAYGAHHGGHHYGMSHHHHHHHHALGMMGNGVPAYGGSQRRAAPGPGHVPSGMPQAVSPAHLNAAEAPAADVMTYMRMNQQMYGMPGVPPTIADGW